MTRYKSVDGIKIALTAEEEAEVVAEEQAWADGQADRDLAALRFERDRLISETDWWAGSDLTMTQAQIDYRQALRDITDSYTSLDDVVWPTKP